MLNKLIDGAENDVEGKIRKLTTLDLFLPSQVSGKTVEQHCSWSSVGKALKVRTPPLREKGRDPKRLMPHLKGRES